MTSSQVVKWACRNPPSFIPPIRRPVVALVVAIEAPKRGGGASVGFVGVTGCQPMLGVKRDQELRMWPVLVLPPKVRILGFESIVTPTEQ